MSQCRHGRADPLAHPLGSRNPPQPAGSRRAARLENARHQRPHLYTATMSTTLFDLTGRVGLVSGAAQGLGQAMALALAEAGADLMLADRNAAGMEKTTGQIAGLGR